MFYQFLNIIKDEFAGYNAKKLSKDILAGITVTAVALPLALAFGVSCGATAASGLITAIIAGIAIGLLSGASYQISGPTGAMTAILIPLVARFGLQGVFFAGLIAGVILIIAGFLRLGRLVYIIPTPVITGFTSGIAIIIALGQIDNFFGTKSHGETAILKLYSYFQSGFNPNIYCILIGLLVVFVMLLWPKEFNKRFPSSLAGLVVALIANVFLHLPIAVVGDIPKTLLPDVRLGFGNMPLEHFNSLIVPGFSIAVLCMIESLLCQAAGSRMKGEKFNADVELISQGVGNVLIPFFGGVPATAAIARTSVAIKSGAKTRLTSVFHAVGLLISMFLLAPIMSQIPLSALAAILVVTAYRMNEWESIRNIFKRKLNSAISKFVITMLATVVLDLTWAIVIGVVFSALLFIIKISDVEINIADVDHEKLGATGINLEQDHKHTKVVYFTGPLFFATIEKLKLTIVDLIASDCDTIILSMRGVPLIDTSGISAIIELVEELEKNGMYVALSGVQPKVMEMLEAGGVINIIGEENFFWDAKEAIVSADVLMTN